MSYNINRATILGNITKEPELRYTPNGKEVTKFSVATNRSYKVGEEWKTEATFHNVIVWGKKAIEIAKLPKGAKVYVEGRIENRIFERTDGSKGNAEISRKRAEEKANAKLNGGK